MHGRVSVEWAKWQQRLESEPEFWGMRLFSPDGGLVWRNKAAREFYAGLGFFAAATYPWAGVKQFLSPNELRALELIYEATFMAAEPVVHVLTAQAPGHDPVQTETSFLAVHGNSHAGVIVTHLRPLIHLRQPVVWPQLREVS